MPPLLAAHRLRKSYVAGLGRCWARVQVLAGVSLVLHPGERVLIVGEAGAGKTTLLHCLAGLRRLDAGTLCWSGAGGAPYRLCADPRDAAAAGAALAIVDLPADPCHAGRWFDALYGARVGRRGWLVFARRAGPLRDLSDRTLELRDGTLIGETVARSRVAEPAEGDRWKG